MIGCINIGQLVVTANENYQMVNKKEKTKGGLISFIDQNVKEKKELFYLQDKRNSWWKLVMFFLISSLAMV